MRAAIRLLFAVVVSAFAIAGGIARADDLPQITVTGEGTVSVAPDTATLRAGVITEAKTAQDAGHANAGAMSALMTAVKDAGIPAGDVKTFGYTIRPVYDNGRPARERIVGFQASNSVLLTVRDLSKVGSLIDRLVAAGANDLGGVDFIVSDSSKALDPAREQALADARRKAELYAKAAGVKLGSPLMISEQTGEPPPIYPMRMRAAGAPPQTPIATGEQSLHVFVTVSYELLR